MVDVWLIQIKKYHVKEKLADFDACSLYPSAMNRIPGYLKGKPKILYDKNYNFIKKKIKMDIL